VLKVNIWGGTQGTVRFQKGTEIKIYPLSDILALTFSNAEPAVSSAKPATVDSKAPAVQSSGPITVPSGTMLLVRMDESISSRKHESGYRFTAHLESDLVEGGRVVAARGSKVYGLVSEAKKSRRLIGKSEMTITLKEIMINNQLYPIVTAEAKTVSEETARKTLRNTARGAAIGGLADGSKGARTGTKIGAGLSILTRGSSVNIPKGTLLEFRLTAPLTK
jgi:hypothetical protein